MARLACRGVGEALLPPLMLGFPPSAERLVYEVRQKCRNIEGESNALDSGSLGRAGGLAPSGLPGAEARLLRKAGLGHQDSVTGSVLHVSPPPACITHTSVFRCQNLTDLWMVSAGIRIWDTPVGPRGEPSCIRLNLPEPDLLALHLSSPSLVQRSFASHVCLPWPSDGVSGSGPSGLGRMGQGPRT